MDADGAPRGWRSYLSARALRRTALRALLLTLALVALILLDEDGRTLPAADLALAAAVLGLGLGCALAPISLVELRGAPHEWPGSGALATGWALSVLGTLLLTVQVIYAVATLDGGSIDAGLQAVVAAAHEVASPAGGDARVMLLLVAGLLPTFLLTVSAIRLGRVSSGMRLLLLVVTFPGGLVALLVYLLVDRLDEGLFERRASARAETPPAA